jgi:hypothetical protein
VQKYETFLSELHYKNVYVCVVLVLAELWMECGFQLELVKMVTN